MEATRIAETLRSLRPDRGNRYAPASVRAKGAAAFEQWREMCRTFGYAVCVKGREMSEADFYAACGYEGE